MAVSLGLHSLLQEHTMDIIKHFDLSLVLMVLARRPPSIVTTEIDELKNELRKKAATEYSKQLNNSDEITKTYLKTDLMLTLTAIDCLLESLDQNSSSD